MFFNKSKRLKKGMSTIGQIIDLPMKQFKKEIEAQKVNVGTMNNIILYLNGAYAELRTRKDGLMKRFDEPDLTDKEKVKIQKAVKGIYAELTKIEEKIIYLKDRSSELVKVDDTEVDSDNKQC